MRAAAIAIAALFLTTAACTEDDANDVPDAGSNADAEPGVCSLTTEPVECTANPECEALCAGSYCHLFGMLGGSVCTVNCVTADDCPDDWTCNQMGRCRPPG
jgi:hypothetical protein